MLQYWKKSFFYKHLGIFLGVTEGVLFGFAQIVVRFNLIGSSCEIQSLFLRSSFELIFILLIISVFFRRTETFKGEPDERIFTILLSIFYTGTQFFIYLAISRSTVLDATVLLKSNILTTICAWIILKERLTFVDIVILISTIVGVILVCHPYFIFGKSVEQSDLYGGHLLGLVFGLIAGICLTVTFILNRKITKSSPAFVSWVQTTVCFVCSGVYTLAFCELSFPVEISFYGFSAAVAILALLGHLAMIRALQIEKAAYIGVATTSEMPTVFVLQIIILRNIPTLTTSFGAIIITVSIICLSLREPMQEKLEKVCKRLRDRILELTRRSSTER